MSEYLVKSAMKAGSYDSDYGEVVAGSDKKVMYKYLVEVEGHPNPIEVSQKPSTAAPKAGDTLSGTITPTPYGDRFKKDAKGGYSGGSKFDSEGMAWGNSLTNATNLVIATPNNIQDPLQVAEKVVEVANYFMMSRPTKTTASTSEATTTPQNDDEPPVESRQPEGEGVPF